MAAPPKRGPRSTETQRAVKDYKKGAPKGAATEKEVKASGKRAKVAAKTIDEERGRKK